MTVEATELLPEIPNLFDFLSTHADMVYDESRVSAFKQAIEETIRPGHIVMDIGTGTGLLALLCAKAGAERVHAIESSPIIRCAQHLAATNNLADRVVFHQESSSTVTIEEPVDVIISELIGHLAFEEGMVETIAEAKGRYLKSGGIIIPQAVTLFGAPVFKPDLYQRYIDCWKKPVCGLDFSYWRGRSLQTPWITRVLTRELVALPQAITEADFIKDLLPNTDNINRFVATRNSMINGVAFWFSAKLVNDIYLSSAPGTKTHWQQCFIPLEDPFKTSRGDTINVTTNIQFGNLKQNPFSIKVAASNKPS